MKLKGKEKYEQEKSLNWNYYFVIAKISLIPVRIKIEMPTTLSDVTSLS